MTLSIGSLNIGLVLNDEGTEIVELSTEGELSIVTMLGMLALCQDSLLHGSMEAVEE